MNNILIAIEDMASALLSPKPTSEVTSKIINEAVKKTSEIMSVVEGVKITEEEIEVITRRLEARFDITMTLGTLFSENYRPWLDNSKGDITWYYWERYKRFLKYPPQVVRSLDSITDQILDHIENPKKEGKWTRKGMVVGHVQSGKTGNYIGLVNKAADSGYKVIIILAGTLNLLRNQTQLRVDNGFIGKDTELKMPVGVGLYSNEKQPAYFTTNTKDFRKSIANQIGVGIGDLKEPVVLVIKKNKTTLENLIDWLKHNNRHNLKNYPMLLIDDEADQASINTNKEGDEATAINKKIRELLHLFERSSYIGYTATPFANVFIDPETETEMLGDDLFPRDFIISLDPPSNYFGSDKIFSKETNSSIVIEVDDFEEYLPAYHKIDWRPSGLPASLEEAIRVFVLSRAIRILRGGENLHNSMMINVTRFTGVQSHLKLLIDEYIKEIRQSIINHYKLSVSEALKNSVMSEIKTTFDKTFSDLEYSWSELQAILKESISPISVIEVNSSPTTDRLDYSEQNYPNGRSVIAVGGLGLSRGLTLEGLTVSYFLRNSIMYDTLMQMGRWFGYREGYEDLCRIYMTSEAASWYAHISDATEELREEFRRMKAAGMSPKDFGLSVRSHPESLIVTARNKMRTGQKVLRGVSLEGRLVETSILLKNITYVQDNKASTETLIFDAKKVGVEIKSDFGPLWMGIPSSHINQFIDHFINHPASQITEKEPLKDYINWLNSQGIDKWDIIIVSLTQDYERESTSWNIGGLEIKPQRRKVTDYPHPGDDGIAFSKRRVASRGLEKAGLTENQVKQAETTYSGKNIPDHAYRGQRTRPLLMIHLLDCRGENEEILFEKGIIAYGISFPGIAGSRRPVKLVEYVVNTTWWKNQYADLMDDDGESEDEKPME